uniref:acireductone dioxygenase (Fe(2+)-requiring) n=1 Tax=Arcella intermedia TaxID=1963864 RepID=A0A6B2LCD3_9EUKA
MRKIKEERNYGYSDVVALDVSLPVERRSAFFEEHFHRDEEIRYFLEGGGYFDCRGHRGEWVRMHGRAGDLIVLPAGISHRYSLDEGNYSKVMRLFTGEPSWTAHKDPTDQKRIDYLESIKKLKYFPQGMHYIKIEDLCSFDSVMSELDLGLEVLVFFVSAVDSDTQEAWCPDVRRALPLVHQALSEREDYFYFVEIHIQKSDYKDNPHFYFREHKKVLLQKIPTLGRWVDGKMQKALVETQLHDLNNIRLFFKN